MNPQGDKYRQRFIERSIEKAKASGLSKEQFTQTFAEELKRFDTERGQRQDKSFLENLGLVLASPFKKTARNIAAAGAELYAQPKRQAAMATEAERTQLFQQAADLARQAQQQQDPTKKAQLLEQSRQIAASAGESAVEDLPLGAQGFMSDAQLAQINEDPTKFLVQEGIKPAAGVLSYALPAKAMQMGLGAGLGVAAKGALAGGMAGGLQGFAMTPETATPLETVYSTAGGAAVGAATGAITAKISDKIAKKLASAKEARVHRADVMRSMHELSKLDDPYIKPSDMDVPSWSEENWIKRTGTRLVGSQTGVPAPLGRTVDANEAFRKMSDYGFANADYWDDAADFVTGKRGIVTKMTQNAVGNAERVDTSGILQQVDDMLADEPLIIPAKRKVIHDFFVRTVGKMGGGTRGQLNPFDDPQTVFETIKNLEGKAASISAGRPVWSITPEDRAAQRVLKLAADELKDRLFEPSVLNEAGKVVMQRGNANAQLVKAVANELDDIRAVSPALADDIAGAKTVAELRNVAKPFVDASKIAREALNTGGSPFYTLGLDRPKGLGRLIGGLGRSIPLLESLLESRPVTAGAGQAMRAIGTTAERGGLLGLPARAITAGMGAVSRGAQQAVANLPTTMGAAMPAFGATAASEMQRRLQAIGRASPEQTAQATGRF